MKNYWDVLPDEFRLMNKHFSRGRSGYKIDRIVLHHLAGIGTALDVWNWWQTRQASAHYVVEESGKVVQMVNDRDAAWANANWEINMRSLTIEHANSGGAAADWPIPETTRIAGARLVAALCRFYGLGRPQWGKTVFGHYQYYSTSCPYHLRPEWKYHSQYMAEAQRFYDELTNPKPGIPAPTEEDFMSALSAEEQRDFYTKVSELHNALINPVPSRVPGSNFKAARVDFIDLIDRKVEELHVEYSGKSSPAQIQADENVEIEANHVPETDEEHHDA